VVRFALPAAAVLLVGMAAFLHRAFVDQGTPDHRLLPVPEVREPVVRQESSRVRPEAPAPSAVLSSKGLPTAKAPIASKVGEPSWRKMSLDLSRELHLGSSQQEAVEQILRDRLEDIRKCHDQIRKSRLLDVQQFEWEVGQMKESWYRKIDALLDSTQHSRFVALVQSGLFNEGLGFTEEPGIVVLNREE
jgi:hypothetical protein